MESQNEKLPPELADLLKSVSALNDSVEEANKRSRMKDILIVVVPLMVAVITVYFSTDSVNKQLTHSRQIESAKIIASFSQQILEGGEGSELAEIAFESVPMSESQREELSSFIEQRKGGPDLPVDIPVDTMEISIDQEFSELLERLFHIDRDVRAPAYTETREYLKAKPDTQLVGEMFDKVRSDPFNIKGRSNVLSILSTADQSLLISAKERIDTELQWIESLGQISPSYAVGPQTKGWLSELENRLSSR